MDGVPAVGAGVPVSGGGPFPASSADPPWRGRRETEGALPAGSAGTGGVSAAGRRPPREPCGPGATQTVSSRPYLGDNANDLAARLPGAWTTRVE
ncbi:hypothetical protein ACFW15_22750, partial [Streptomyces sp. NPDC058953]